MLHYLSLCDRPDANGIMALLPRDGEGALLATYVEDGVPHASLSLGGFVAGAPPAADPSGGGGTTNRIYVLGYFSGAASRCRVWQRKEQQAGRCKVQVVSATNNICSM